MDSIKIIGGGLSGCLLLFALKHRWPHLKVTLCESSDHLSGHQTWSFHHDDVPERSWPWLKPLISHSWQGYDVYFPQYSKSFSTSYYSISAQSLAEKTKATFSDRIQFNTQSPFSENDIHATGWPKITKKEDYGFQKFVGLEVELKSPHRLTRPILKDVRWPQSDGYRFFYTLPLSENRLLIEDTYYSNQSDLDVEEIKKQIFQYAESKSWKIDKIIREEKGSLPLALHNDTSSETLSPLALGAAAHLAHPVTGYTFPIVIRQIQALLDSSESTIPEWKKALQKENLKIRKPFGYYYLLNRMLFRAAQPEKRYQILQRFYKLPENLIQRFYGGRSTKWDQIRILVGKPPVPLLRAAAQLRK